MNSIYLLVAVTASRGRNLSKQDAIELEGKVVEPLPNAMFNVELENGKTILCILKQKEMEHLLG